MSTEIPPGGLFDRDLDAWPAAPAPHRPRLAPRARARRGGLIVLASVAALVLTDVGLIGMIPTDPFDGGMRHPWLVLGMLATDFLIGIGVAAIVGVGLWRLLLPDGRPTRPADPFLPIKFLTPEPRPGPVKEACKISRRRASGGTMLLGCIMLLIACPIVFVMTLAIGCVAIGGGERTDLLPNGALPVWVEVVPAAVAAIATLGLGALIVVSFARGQPGPTPRQPD